MTVGRWFRVLGRSAIGGGLLIVASAGSAVHAECGTKGANGPAAITVGPPIVPSSSLRSRVGPPSDLVLETFRKAGAADVAEHRLTDREWAQFDAALASLPRFQIEVLRRHLRRISFVSASTSMGTALTSLAETCDEGPAQYDITLRATLFNEGLTDFLNRKERGLFADDGSGYQVHIDAGDMGALPYILLHEATHVVDLSLGVSELSPNPFKDGIWGDGRGFAPPYRNNPVNSILWRGGSKVPLARAANLYRGLGETPFVSNYAAAAPGEDIADTVAWQQLSTRYDVKLRIEVRDATGKRIHTLAPLDSPLVRKRFAAVEQLLAGSLTPAADVETRN